jgi:hypothetical protein
MFRMSPLRDPLEPADAARHRSPTSASAPQAALPWRIKGRRVAPEVEPPLDIESIIARGHSKVMDHYYQLLRSPSLTAAERADIEARIAREEKYWLEQQPFGNAP